MRININTTIGSILKHNPQALEAIVSISPKFEKLRNPLLRKLMAGRTTIAMASRMGDCAPEDFFAKLRPLDFQPESATVQPEAKKQLPAFLENINSSQITTFDVNPLLASGKDPLKDIQARIKALAPGNVLKIISPFEPAPLVVLLEKQGFHSYVDVIAKDRVETYFYKKANSEPAVAEATRSAGTEDWDRIMTQFKGNMQDIDVRELEMPQPMLTILAALDSLPAGNALYVHHKRIPVFLLPELNDRGFEYRVKEISENEVYLLIFKSK